MAAQLIAIPFRPVINIVGGLAAGAQLDVFAAGTTTRITVYADASLTTQLPNPVVANGAGRLPSIYFNDNTAIRIRLRDRLGSVIDDVDPYFYDFAEAQDAADEAATQAAVALTRANAASSSATTAAGSATTANTAATNAAASATTASTAATNAGTAATTAAANAAIAAAAAAAAASSPAEITPDFFGAVGDGTTDDAVALQLALDSGRRILLPTTKEYAFGSTLTPPNGGGFIGGGTLIMLTGTGKFDRTSYSGATETASGIYIDGKSDVVIDAKITMQANAGLRTCNPIHVRNSSNVRINAEVTGFKEVRFGLVEWNTNVGGEVNLYAHDCGTDTTSTSLPSIQISALSIDNNREGGINSTPMTFNVKALNLTMGATTVTNYGKQTDAVNIQGANQTGESGRGYGGHVGSVTAENVYEPLDIFSDHNVVSLTARNCLFGVKLFHGASHNVINATVDRYEKAAVVIGGNLGVQGTSNNKVIMNSTGGGDVGGLSDVSAALIDGAGAGADGNVIEITDSSPGGNLDYVATIAGGDNNTIVYEGADATGQAGRILNGLNNRTERKRKAVVRAILSANTSIANDNTVIFNTEQLDTHGEYNPATGIYTAKSACTLRVTYRASGQSIAAGAPFGSYIRRGPDVVSRKTDRNFGASGSDVFHEHSALVAVAPGDTVFIRSDTSGSVTHLADVTQLEIQEL